jgi:hypothetical protein
MPADLSVFASHPPRTLLREVDDSRAGQSRAAPGGAPAPPQPNPTFRLDPALNIVVLELHDQAGNVVSSFPTEQQLNAYRTGERRVPETIGGMTAPAASSAELRPPKAPALPPQTA